MGRVNIIDLSLRDGHQSLAATRMRTRDMIPVLELIDEAGFYSIEMWGGATFDVMHRFLNENPWERIRTVRKYVKETHCQMLLRGQNLVGYRHYADDVVEKFVQKAVENGISFFRIFDALNDVRNLEVSIKSARKYGAEHVQGSICYVVSPVHTLEKYVETAEELAALEVDSIVIKDMAGMISPKKVYELVRALKKEIGLPVNVHSHYTSGMATMTMLKAVEAGAEMIDTAMSPWACGTSHPPTESLVYALEELGYSTGVNMDVLMEIRKHLLEVREKYAGYIKTLSTIPDTRVLKFQIPGGMFSNMLSQLEEQNALDRLEEVLEEVPRVQADLGYPPLVTPTSQIVGVQAVLNVLFGRYKMVTKETRDLVKGMYGKTPAPISDEIIKLILKDEKPITVRPADLIEPEFEKARQELIKEGIENPSDEDVLIYALFPSTGLKFLKGEAKEEPFPAVEGEVRGEFEVEIEGKRYVVKVE